MKFLIQNLSHIEYAINFNSLPPLKVFFTQEDLQFPVEIRVLREKEKDSENSFQVSAVARGDDVRKS